MIDPRNPDYLNTPASPQRPLFGYAPDPADDEGPAVTVLTPFFNTGEVFHETARCVLAQSLQRFEWVIVNDGSSDPAALRVLDSYRGGDPRIRVIDHRVNRGLSAARNTGFRAARTPYVFMLDSDDLIEPTTLEKCVLYIECNPQAAFVKGYSVGFEGQTYLWSRGFHEGSAFLEQNLVTATALVRTRTHARVGAFDESIRGGLEDWEFWIRCAAYGAWGATIPEHLDWYRRRPNQHDAWTNLASKQAHARFRRYLGTRYATLYRDGISCPCRPEHKPLATVPDAPPFRNRLTKPGKRLLLIAPWLRMGGADRFNLDLTRFLASQGWGVTIVTTLPGQDWLPEFTRFTPDVFVLPNLAAITHFPRLLAYFIGSRDPDVVLLSNSELGYQLLPYLRAACPGPAYADFNHMEEPGWQNGGHPRSGAAVQEQLDLNIVVSEHLKRWMTERGAEPQGIEVCYINADTRRWAPDERARGEVRAELGVADDTPVVLYAARLCAQKQPLVFVRTVQMLHERGERFLAVVAGDGEDRGAMCDAIERAGLWDHVRFLGAVETDRMPALMAASDIFFLPSQWEGIALSVYEAMSVGLAVVGADVGGQRELVTEGCGVLLPRRVRCDPDGRPGFDRPDPEAEAAAYADALAGLFADPDRRRCLGRSARQRIQDSFELANMGDRMLELLDRAVQNSRDWPLPILPRRLAHEIATQAVELWRLRAEKDTIWGELERLRAAGRRQRAVSAADPAELALGFIESAAAFRLLRRAKTTPLYRLFARARFGPGWDVCDAREPPAVRLARIRASRSYRVISAIKRQPPAAIVARLRHGREYWKSIPEPLRADWTRASTSDE